MAVYSHSRLSSYENCPLGFKFAYIDKLKGINGIEGFLGNQVHEAIHFIYKMVKSGKMPTLDEVFRFYRDIWGKDYNHEIRIVRKGMHVGDYFKQGLELIKYYYNKHKPFNENIIGMEQKILIDLDGKGDYVLQGFIDKLIHNKKDGTYEIHDYKTSKWLPDQDELDNDRQLALYSIGVKEQYPNNNGIILKWHYLRHDKVVTSARTDEQLEQLKKDVIELIKKIESAEKWPAKKSRLCDWCGFNHLCLAYKESKKMFPF